MQVLKLNRTSEGFYSVMGPIFGSRRVERDTRDRFYDDSDKEWYVVPERGAASVKEGVIRNFWAVDGAADALLERLLADYPALKGVIPRRYEETFKRVGFQIDSYRVNFLEVRYVETD